MDDGQLLARLEQRVQVLEDERSILDTLYAYGHSLDYGVREEWMDVGRPTPNWSGRIGLSTARTRSAARSMIIRTRPRLTTSICSWNHAWS